MDTVEAMAAFAEELESTAELHRFKMRETDDQVTAAEHRGISRGMLFVASKIRTTLLKTRDEEEDGGEAA